MSERVKLSQSAPVIPVTKKEMGKETYGVQQPVSSVTLPSVYNKKLNKLFRGRLAVLTGDIPVADAIRRMARFNISSVPVTKSKKDNTILGFVDTLDFLAYLCKLLSKESGGKVEIDQQNLAAKTDTFKKTRISELVDMSQRDPFKCMNGEESLSDAVEQYLKGIHRIAITDDDGDLLGVVSQWTIANYLDTVPTDEIDWIPTLREPIRNSKFTSNVECVNWKESTLDCFIKMHNKKLSALAVIDDSGKLVGNLSASDLKGFQLFLKDFNDLLQPLSSFLSIVRKKQGREENFAVGVSQDTSVRDVVGKLNEEIIHRVYIVDNDNKPIGIFSLTDLMQIIITDTHKISTFASTNAITESD